MKKIISFLGTVVLLATMFTFTSFAAMVNIPSDASVYNGHSYKIYDNGVVWDDAESFCERMGGHLVTITSVGEQKLVESIMKNGTSNSYWIGGIKKSDKFVWITNESMSYTNFEGIFQYDQIYLVIHNKQTDNFGLWYDHDNEIRDDFYDYTKNGFICEWDTAPTSYTATFKDNGGIKTLSGTKITTPSISTKNGWTSVGWTTLSGIPASETIAANTSYTLISDKTFYALYEKNLTLTYNANGGKNEPSSQKQTIYYNACGLTQTSIFNLSKTVPTRDGYKFLGWSIDKNASKASYTAGQTVEMNENSATTLYAVWQKNKKNEIKIEIKYKDTFKFSTDSFKATKYTSDNYDVASVSSDGTITGTGKGSTDIHIFDTAGNETVIHVTVNYEWWQWIIVIVLFGWIWY